MTDEQLRELARRMNVINPYEGANPLGNCRACAVHVADAFLRNLPFREVGKSTDDDPSRFVRPYSFKEETRVEKLQKFIPNLPPGSVAIFADGDHAFNVLTDRDGTRYLLDSNQQIYRQVKRLADFVVTCRGDATRPTGDLDLLTPRDGALCVYGCGLLHPEYRFTDPPARPEGKDERRG